jgi:hypothetical protein
MKQSQKPRAQHQSNALADKLRPPERQRQLSVIVGPEIVQALTASP